ncbi:hypothetical protein E4U41_003906 [Claviceps citrina]|nr:hypothetical protein E4U41_003906 [Claviceps citrina]
MDLLNTIRKTGSRGGVNFSWDEVASSAHRENYLGHSLKAPVGRWQKGKDLNWYAKSDEPTNPDETDEEKLARQRKEELKRIKEAEEDAMARALGLPPPMRNTSGANAVEVAQQRAVGTVAGGAPDDEVGSRERRGHDKHGRTRRHDDSEGRERRRRRSRSRDRDRDRDGETRHRRRSRERDSGHRSRSRDRNTYRQRGHDSEARQDGRRRHSDRHRSRSRSPSRRDRRREGRSDDHGRGHREARSEPRRNHGRERSSSLRPSRGD